MAELILVGEDIPVFIVNDPVAEREACIAFYEAENGVIPQPGSPEMRVINMMVARLTDHKSGINSAALMQLLPYSKAPILDYVVSLVGVTRLVAAEAQTTVEFVLPETHGSIVFPKDMRIQTTDGKFVFELAEDLVVGADVETITAICICDTPGAGGNDYLVGDVSIILDPQPLLISASNITVTNSGSDQETDEQLRERAMLAPSSFSVAGPVDAYKFFAKSANPLIIDVAIPNPPAVPGTVVVYPLVPGGIDTPAEVLTQVYNILSSEKIRPLCDTVSVVSPTKTGYDLVVKITKITGAVNGDILGYVEPKLTDYLQELSLKLGRDVLVSKIKRLVCYDDTQVYDCALFLADGTTPFVDIVVNETTFAYADSITVTIVGENVG